MNLNSYSAPYKLWDHQQPVVQELIERWNQWDTGVVDSPVGTGKSLVGQTLARWAVATQGYTVATVVPRVDLQDQQKNSFPDMPSLAGANRYQCHGLGRRDSTCAEVKAVDGTYCKGCKCQQARQETYGSANALYNFHSYIFNPGRKRLIIVDEAHMLYSLLADYHTIQVWQHKDKYPDGLVTHGDLLAWMSTVMRKLDVELAEATRQYWRLNQAKATIQAQEIRRRIGRLQAKQGQFERVYEGVQRDPTTFFIEHRMAPYLSGEKPQLWVRPNTLRGLRSPIWDKGSKDKRVPKTDKILLMSGTLDTEDLPYLGVEDIRPLVIHVKNPIEAVKRPFIMINESVNMAYKYRDGNIPKMIELIKKLADHHWDGKGVVHTTYAIAAKLALGLNGARYMFHNQDNKDAVLKQFLATDKPKILVACGLSEGLDLKGVEYSWQAITKVIYPDLSDAMIASWYKTDNQRIVRMTVKSLIQTYGRICRGIHDYGITYCLDLNFGNPYTKQQGIYQRAFRYWPKYFKEALSWRSINNLH